MGEGTTKQRAQAIKIVGNAAAGTPTYWADVDAAGNLKTVNPAHAVNDTAVALQSDLVAGRDEDGFQRPLKVDDQGRLVTSALTGFGAAFSFGDVQTAASTTVPVRRTTYTEPVTGGKRSIASASAADAGAGTGARTVLIHYYKSDFSGPYNETLTLNGTTGVNTVETDMRYIEHIDVLTAGSGRTNAGIITLYTAINKGGTAIGTITAGDNQTFWAHHYVPLGKTCNVTGISCSHNGTTVGSGAVFTLKALALDVANAIEQQVSDFVRLYGQSSTFSRNYQSPIKVDGPARLTLDVTPESTSSFRYRAAIDFFEP